MKRQMKMFWLLTAFATLSSIGSSMVIPYLPLYGEEIGMSIGLVGYLIFANYVVATFTRIPIGSLSDLFGHGRVILGGSLALIAAAILYLMSPHWTGLLFVAQFFFGLGTSITWVTIPAFVTNMRGSVSKYSFAVGLGWLTGPPLGGYIKDAWGMYPLFLAFLVFGLGLLALALGFLRTAGGEEERSSSTNGEVSPRETVRTLLGTFGRAARILRQRTGVMVAGVASFVMFMNFSMGASLVPIYLKGIGFLSFQIGLLQSLRSASSTGIRLAFEPIKRMAKKWFGIEDEGPILVIGMGLTGLPVLLMTLTDVKALIALLLMFWGMAGGLYLPIVIALIRDSADREERGLAMGLRGTMGTFGSALGVLVLSNLAEIFSIEWALQVLGCFIVLFAVGFFVVLRTDRNNLAPAPARGEERLKDDA